MGQLRHGTATITHAVREQYSDRRLGSRRTLFQIRDAGSGRRQGQQQRRQCADPTG